MKYLTIARRLPFAILLWPLLCLCTALIMFGWGKQDAKEFWQAIT